MRLAEMWLLFGFFAASTGVGVHLGTLPQHDRQLLLIHPGPFSVTFQVQQPRHPTASVPIFRLVTSFFLLRRSIQLASACRNSIPRRAFALSLLRSFFFSLRAVDGPIARQLSPITQE
jgi:hypothetical protein